MATTSVPSVDYSSKAKSQGLRLVPDPDVHIHPDHVPDTVQDKVAECIQHSTQVLRRQISSREKRLVSALGAAWDIKQAPIDGPYFLQCARSDICDNFEYVQSVFIITHTLLLHTLLLLTLLLHTTPDAKTCTSFVSRMVYMVFIAVLRV